MSLTLSTFSAVKTGRPFNFSETSVPLNVAVTLLIPVWWLATSLSSAEILNWILLEYHSLFSESVYFTELSPYAFDLISVTIGAIVFVTTSVSALSDCLALSPFEYKSSALSGFSKV